MKKLELYGNVVNENNVNGVANVTLDKNGVLKEISFTTTAEAGAALAKRANRISVIGSAFTVGAGLAGLTILIVDKIKDNRRHKNLKKDIENLEKSLEETN